MLCKKCSSINLNKNLGETLRRELSPSLTTLIKSANSGCDLCQLVYSELKGKVSAAAAQVSYSCGDKNEGGFRTLVIEVFDRGRCLVEESLDLYASANSLAAKSNLIAGRPINSDPLSDACIAQIQQWLEHCMKNHARCPLKEAPRMPTRVIDVGDEYTKPRLLVNAPVDTGKWVALSHCWGDVNKLFTTRTTNINVMKGGIHMDDLPATVRDAVLVTRKLGLQYLWVDNLCIVQDNDKDFARENVRMGEYYHNAYLTIVASDAHSDDEGFLRPRLLSSDSDSEVKVPMKKAKGSSEHFFISRRRSSSLENEPISSVIHGRAWCLQESALAVRVLEFTNEQIRWSCASRSIDESGRSLKAAYAGILTLTRQALNATTFTSEEQKQMIKKGLGKITNKFINSAKKSALGQSLMNELPDRSFRLGNLNTWYDTVENFMARRISFTSDRLPALGAIARVIQEQTGDTYIAGIWKRDFIRGLAWTVSGRERETYQPKLRDAEAMRPPSWSWASVEANVHYPVESRQHTYRDDSCWRWSEYPFPERSNNIANICGYAVYKIDLDEFGRLNGGSIRLEAKCRPARDLESSRYSQTKIKRKHSDFREFPSPYTWQMYWDHQARFEHEKSDDSLEMYKLCMLMRGPHMYSPGESKHTTTLWSQLSMNEDVRAAPNRSGLFLTVALVLEKHKSGDWKRVGLVEIYDTDGWAPGVGWVEEDLTIL